MEEAVSATQEAIKTNSRTTAKHLVQQIEVSTICHDDLLPFA
jgi:hypothetical protein